jgi:hypothetical protein
MDPALAALADQVTAASAELQAAVAAQPGYEPRSGSGEVTAALVDAMRGQVLSGGIRQCEHLDWQQPAPVIWEAWSPGKLLCLDCTAASAGATCCSSCGLHGALHGIRVSIGPAVAILGDGSPGFRPPAVVLAQLCPDCLDDDDKPARRTGQDVPAGVWLLHPAQEVPRV